MVNILQVFENGDALVRKIAETIGVAVDGSLSHRCYGPETSQSLEVFGSFQHEAGQADELQGAVLQIVTGINKTLRKEGDRDNAIRYSVHHDPRSTFSLDFLGPQKFEFGIRPDKIDAILNLLQNPPASFELPKRSFRTTARVAELSKA